MTTEQDVDDSKWETSKDGTVVKKQPGMTCKDASNWNLYLADILGCGCH